MDGQDQQEPKRAEGLLVIDDGYTLLGECKSDHRPAVTIRYRPARPEAVHEYRLRFNRATAGADRWAAVLWLLEAHVESWDGVFRRRSISVPGGSVTGEAVPFWTVGRAGEKGAESALRQPAVQTAVPIEYLDQMVNYVTGYELGRWEADAKNS